MTLNDYKNFHFIGLGGSGMSALAKILLELGKNVSGSDQSDSEILSQLSRLGAKTFIGHAAEHIDKNIDVIVVSSAIPDSNPEVVEAKNFGITQLHRSDINAMLLNSKKGIAVAGSHGKTTTTAMIGVALDHANVSPTIIIGGESPDLGTNAKLGSSEFLVSEADESDGSFLKLQPYIAVVTNVEDDHLDHYGSVENIKTAFKKFIESSKRAVVCLDSKNLRDVAADVKTPLITYAIDHSADFRAVNVKPNGSGMKFEVEHDQKILGSVELKIPGVHNVLNALATVAVGTSIGVPFEKLADGLRKFHGAKRRFQTKGKINGVWIVDDYGHHPTEISSTLSAARQTEPKRLICVFQPHRYTRTKLLAKEFSTAFAAADLLILTDVYSAGEEPIEGISGKTILDEVTNSNVKYIPRREDLASYLKTIVQTGDLVITMGAGDIYKTADELLKLLSKKILVVMGGTSTEAEVSRRTGAAIVKALLSRGFEVEPMELHPKTFSQEVQDSNCAIVFNALHGKFGEDGLLQGTLDMLGIPYTGSGVLASALTIDKVATKKYLISANIPTARSVSFRRSDKNVAEEIEKKFSLPVVVKAATQGSSIGVEIVETKDELQKAVETSFKYDEEILVEEFIRGRELTVAVFGNYLTAKAMPIIEITTTSGRYDYASKYTKGASKHICPAELSEELTAKIQSIAVDTFKACGCRGVARVDFMLDEQNQPYVLEVNTVPGMTETSLVPDAARAMGIDFPTLCEKILQLAGFER